MTVPMLRSLHLERFRSLPSAIVEFDNPTFLVGENGTGKSNVADALAFLAEAMTSPLPAVFERRGGIDAVGHRSSARGRPSDLEMRVVLENLDEETSRATYEFKLRSRKRHEFEVVRERCVVEGQSYGGAAQGIGTALFEESLYDDNGQPLTSTFADYVVPGPTELPSMRIEHSESLSPFTRHGIKGIGEGAAIAPAGAVVNAINDALTSQNVEINEIPATPRRILTAILEAQARGSGAREGMEASMERPS